MRGTIGLMVDEPMLGGRHLRLETPKGPIHVWVSPGAPTATVVYVHGYYDNADQAFSKYRLAEQFKASGRPAVYIVPEAPVGNTDQVRFPELGALLDQVRAAGVATPSPVLALGHSGAFRTLVKWLPHPSLAYVGLIDALYGNVSQFASWGRQPGHVIDTVTIANGLPATNAPMLDKQVGAVVRKGPALDQEAMKAKALHWMLPALGHFQLVTPPTSVIGPLLHRAGAAASIPGWLIGVIAGLAALAIVK